MKERLNLTIDEALIEEAKKYARKHHISLSQMVEKYLKTITRPSHKKNIIEFIEELPEPKPISTDNLKKNYYEHRKKKYGF